MGSGLHASGFPGGRKQPPELTIVVKSGVVVGLKMFSRPDPSNAPPLPRIPGIGARIEGARSTSRSDVLVDWSSDLLLELAVPVGCLELELDEVISPLVT